MVHGAVNIFGSYTVTSYWMLRSFMRVKRSTRRRSSRYLTPSALAPMPSRPPIKFRRLDYESVAFPVPARVAHIGAQFGGNMRTWVVGRIERNNASLVDHLIENRNPPG